MAKKTLSFSLSIYKKDAIEAGLTSKDYRIELPEGETIWDELN